MRLDDRSAEGVRGIEGQPSQQPTLSKSKEHYGSTAGRLDELRTVYGSIVIDQDGVAIQADKIHLNGTAVAVVETQIRGSCPPHHLAPAKLDKNRSDIECRCHRRIG